MRNTVSTLFCSALVLGLSVSAPMAQQVGSNTGSIGTLSGVPTPSESARSQVPGHGVGTLGPQSQIPGLIQQNAQPIAFRDPKRGFVIAAPTGAKFDRREESGQVLIQSRKGYGLSIQAGDANANIPTHDMFSKLEAQYLGDSKPWSKKTYEDDHGVVGGLPAGVAIYESGASRTQVIIARGAKTDFVFMFFAPTSRFEALTPELEWILTSFRPGEGEQPAVMPIVQKPAPKPAAPEVRAASEPTAIASRPVEPVVAAADPAMRVFSESGYGYRVAYPTDWNLEKMSAFTNVISGQKGTDAYEAMVTMQNVKPTDGNGDVAQSAFANLKNSLASQAKNVAFMGEKPVTYTKNGLTLTGRQFVANYEHAGRAFRKWALVLPRPEGDVAHIWSYTAPLDKFETYRPIAEGILNSLKIDGAKG
ncbi:hypothetical protein N9L49_04675 [Rhodospirillales bacterium]|nr:hypothetical protein [Rhodospirillales bacterium]